MHKLSAPNPTVAFVTFGDFRGNNRRRILTITASTTLSLAGVDETGVRTTTPTMQRPLRDGSGMIPSRSTAACSRYWQKVENFAIVVGFGRWVHAPPKGTKHRAFGIKSTTYSTFLTTYRYLRQRAATTRTAVERALLEVGWPSSGGIVAPGRSGGGRGKPPRQAQQRGRCSVMTKPTVERAADGGVGRVGAFEVQVSPKPPP